MQIIYLDTETTDNKEDARLIQLAYKNPNTGEEVNEYFKSPVPISFGAMAVHHITNKMVEDKPVFEGSEYKKNLENILNDVTVVAHNALFDINILKNEGVVIEKYIDTLRIARHLIDSESYGLQYLRYFLDFDIESQAHDAWGDILVLEKLFEHLKNIIKTKFNLDEEGIYNKMIELTNQPVLMDNINFGKHRGKTFKEIADQDMGYLEWLYGSESSKSKSEQNEDLVYTLKHYIS